MDFDTLILDVAGRGLHHGRHIGAGPGELTRLLELDYGRTTRTFDPLLWNDTARLLDRIAAWAADGADRVPDRGPGRLVILSTLCTRFRRSHGTFLGLALASSVQGRPSTMVDCDALLGALSVQTGDIVVLLDLVVVPSRLNTNATGRDAAAVADLIAELAKSRSANLLLCATPGIFELNSSAGYRASELSTFRSLKSLADRGKPFSVHDLHAEMTRRADDLHDVTICVSAPGRQPVLLQPRRTSPRFPEYIIDDLYSPGPGSRLDAVAELADIVQGYSNEADPDDARTALVELSKLDPDPSVRAECIKSFQRSKTITVDDLKSLEICHDEVDRHLLTAKPPEFVAIPAGRHRIGAEPETGQWFERPAFDVHLPAFAIARTPVTNGQYYVFVKESGWPVPGSWVSDAMLLGQRDHPVVYVSYYDSVAFCEWQTTKLRSELPEGARVCLPTELEWEAAARWPDGRAHPWGDVFDARRCNTLGAGLGAVIETGAFSPAGDTSAGVIDMIGNVWEWTESLWGASGRAPAQLYPLPHESEPVHRSAPNTVRRIVRGAAFYYTDECANAYTRNRAYPEDIHKAGSFRPVIRLPRAGGER